MAAASDRVSQLRAAHPHASTEELVGLLIRHKCWQAGVIGAVTSGLAIIPGLGTVAALTFGVPADIGMTRADFVNFAAQVVTGEDEVEAAVKVYTDTTGAAKTKLEGRIDSLFGTINGGLGQSELPDTAYKAAQGLAEWIDHQRNRSAKWRNANKALGLDSALFGDGAKTKSRGVALLLKRAA